MPADRLPYTRAYSLARQSALRALARRHPETHRAMLDKQLHVEGIPRGKRSHPPDPLWRRKYNRAQSHASNELARRRPQEFMLLFDEAREVRGLRQSWEEQPQHRRKYDY